MDSSSAHPATSSPTVHAEPRRGPGDRRRVKKDTLFADLSELVKARIAVMVVVTTAVGYLMASPLNVGLRAFDPIGLLTVLLGTALVAGGAGVLNQVVEREPDSRMDRTAGRPIPAGRISSDTALVLGVLLSITGLAQLAYSVNLLTALLGAATLAGYVFIYTPLKRVSSLATIVGAVPGAVPPMMGWTAARDAIEPGAWALFGILFLWQMPHFLAIAWMYRDDYQKGGFPMLPVFDPDGSRTGRQAVLYAAALVPVSLLPTVLGHTGVLYFVGAALLSGAYFLCSFGFNRRRHRGTAHRLLLASVIYLPALLAVMLVDRIRF